MISAKQHRCHLLSKQFSLFTPFCEMACGSNVSNKEEASLVLEQNYLKKVLVLVTICSGAGIFCLVLFVVRW